MKTLLWLMLSSWALAGKPHTVVDLGYARFQGTGHPVYNDTNAFYGLRYAAPPAGDLRWRAPVDIERSHYYSHHSINNATTPGPQCMQGLPGWQPSSTGGSLDPGSEDCLLLNIMVPKHPISHALPVLINIHGGGYVQGSSSDGGFFVSASSGSVILVSIQYRLGGLGFLGNADVRNDGTANAGLLDQRSAIQWVQRHIRAFGGDPTKVTIQGGSAGGGSVSAQLMLYGGEEKPPFRAAIAEYPWFQPFHDEPTLRNQYQDLLSASSCTDLNCLRALPYDSLFQAINETYYTGYTAQKYGYGDFYYGPSVDGTIIRGLPTAEYAAGRYSKVPLITNRDAFEGLFFSNFTLTNLTADLSQLWPASTPSFLSSLTTLWPSPSNLTTYLAPLTNSPYFQSLYSGLVSSNTAFWRRQDIFSQALINCHTSLLATSLESHCIPSWKMIYSSGTEVHGAVDAGVYSPADGEASEEQAKLVQRYFLNFVRELDPNEDGLTNWPRYGPEGKVLDVNLTSVEENFDRDREERCQFLLENGAVLRN